MINAVAYCRYSSEKQNDGFSIEAQKRAITEFAKTNNYKIIEFYVDEAKSGTSMEHRDNFKKLLEDSKKHLFSAVIVHKFDRFARSRIDSAIAKNELKKQGVKVISVLENLNDSPESVILESVIEGMNEYYSKNLSRETKKGMKEAARKGLSLGPLSFGYTKNENREIIINESEAKVVRNVFTRFLANEPMISILNSLNNDPLIASLRKKKYTYHFINYMLKNRVYIGERAFKDEVIENAYPIIIDRDTFNEVQLKMEQNLHRVQVNPSPSSNKKSTYPMSGLLFDSSNNVFVGFSSIKKGKKHYYYFAKKTKKYYQKSFIDKLALNSIVTIVENDSTAEYITNLVNENLALNDPNEEKETIELKKNLTSLQTKKERLLDMYLSGDVDKALYIKKKEELENDEYNVSAKLRELDKVVFKSVSVDVIKNCFHHLAINIKKEVDSDYSLQLLFRYFIKKAIISSDEKIITFFLTLRNEPSVAYELSSGDPIINLYATFAFSLSPKLINISNCYLTSTV